MIFPSTNWTLLAQTTLEGQAEARAALEELCRRYWLPLHHFIRRRGFSETEAQDVTQEFLLHLLEHNSLERADRERGRFRSFLLGALMHFLADEFDRRHALKRGAGVVPVPLDDSTDVVANPNAADDSSFDREWALATLENAFRRLECEFAGAGKTSTFAVLRSFLPGALETPGYEVAAAQLVLSLPAFKSEVHRARQRFKLLLREEVTATVSLPHEIEDEITHLQQVLMNPGTDLGSRLKPSPPIS
jgi:RNA polymerase sigma-70 factor (ECF subfamily)